MKSTSSIANGNSCYRRSIIIIKSHLRVLVNTKGVCLKEEWLCAIIKDHLVELETYPRKVVRGKGYIARRSKGLTFERSSSASSRAAIAMRRWWKVARVSSCAIRSGILWIDPRWHSGCLTDWQLRARSFDCLVSRKKESRRVASSFVKKVHIARSVSFNRGGPEKEM